MKTGILHIDRDLLRICLGLPKDVDIVRIYEDPALHLGEISVQIAGERDDLPEIVKGSYIPWVAAEFDEEGFIGFSSR